MLATKILHKFWMGVVIREEKVVFSISSFSVIGSGYFVIKYGIKIVKNFKRKSKN